MASSEARGPLGMFVGFLLVALGVTLYKPQPQPQPGAPVAATSPSGLPDNGKTDKKTTDTAKSGEAEPVKPGIAGAPDADHQAALSPSTDAPTSSASGAPAPPAGATPADIMPGEAPHFDIVRVEPAGETVVAGKGAPNAKIQLLGQGRVIGEAQADAGGNFVILPPTLGPGSYDLSLRQQTPGQPQLDSKQSVAVAIPQKGGSVVVALAEPGKPTKLLGTPQSPVDAADPKASDKSASLGAPSSKVGAPVPMGSTNGSAAIHSVELENGNGFFASGSAKPGSPVHIYLNGAHIADVVAGVDGQWSLTLKKGLKGGHYVVRADVADAKSASSKPAGPKNASVVARVEVPFDVPVAMAESAPTADAGSPTIAKPSLDIARPAAMPAQGQTTAVEPKSPTVALDRPGANGANGSNAVIAELETALVVNGDNLWNISRARLGYGRRFTQIYAANTAQIRDPRLIYPGQVLVVPQR